MFSFLRPAKRLPLRLRRFRLLLGLLDLEHLVRIAHSSASHSSLGDTLAGHPSSSPDDHASPPVEGEGLRDAHHQEEADGIPG